MSEEVVAEIICEHKEFDATVNVMRFDENKALAMVRIVCKECRQPLKSIGLPEGISLETATCAASGTVTNLAMQVP